MASKKAKTILKFFLFLLLPVAGVVWWFKFRLRDKNGATYKYGEQWTTPGYYFILRDGVDSGGVGKDLRIENGFATVNGINTVYYYDGGWKARS